MHDSQCQIQSTKVPAFSWFVAVRPQYGIHEDMEGVATVASYLVEAPMEALRWVEQEEEQGKDVKSASHYNGQNGIGKMLSVEIRNCPIEIALVLSMVSIHIKEVCWC